MALKKTIDLAGGYQAEYHMLAQVNIDRRNQQAHAELLTFRDRAARLAGKRPVESFAFDWNAEDFPFTLAAVTANNVYVVAYTAIKVIIAAGHTLTGAEDVIE